MAVSILVCETQSLSAFSNSKATREKKEDKIGR
jgi:hypothetical protein